MTERANDMEADLRSRVVALERQVGALEPRTKGLEDWRTQREIESARHDEKWKHMDDRFNRLEQKLAGVSDTLTWIMRIVIGGILMGVVAFLIRGGFSP